MQTYLITLGRGLQGPSRMNGALFLGEQALYFLCSGVGVTAGYEFGSFGEIGAALEAYKKTGVEPTIDEAALSALIPTTPNGIVIPVGQIEQLSRAFCSGSKIVHEGGKKLVVWNPGFAGQFRDNAKVWAASKGIKTEGL